MRLCEDWIESYLSYTDPTEPPPDFHYWTGLFVIATVTGRKIFLDRGHYTLYPNLFIILLAKSALCRKSSALDIGSRLLNALNPPIRSFGDTVTAPALLHYGIELSAKITICASEMETLISDVFKTGLSPMLTRLYDSPDYYDGKTVCRGAETLKDVYLNIIGATTPEDLGNSVPARKAGGGFASRFVIVHREKPHKRNEQVIVDEALWKDLITDLQTIRQLKGGFVFTTDSKQWYKKWYLDHCNWAEELSDTPVVLGYHGRKHDLLLKIAMSMQLSRSDNLILDTPILQAALAMLELNEPTQMKAYMLIGASDKGAALQSIKDIIKRHKVIEHSVLMRSVSYKHDAKELNELIETLAAERTISITISPRDPKDERRGGGRVYEWRG